MIVRHITRLLGAATLAAGAVLSSTSAPQAIAAPCPDAEIVFARGSGEPPGVGGVGQGFVDALRAQLGAKTVDVYPVNYAATDDFNDRDAVARTVSDGVRDAGAHIQATAANCPNTRIVLGGYSQGAVLASFVTSTRAPAGVPASLVPKPLPPSTADHVAAVALFGNPSPAFLQQYNAPEATLGPLYADKTIALCAPGDTICDGTPNGQPTFAHVSYGFNGMTAQAATFAAERIAGVPAAPAA
jgi:hypothetical protein